jgi:hypothetical protein
MCVCLYGGGGGGTLGFRGRDGDFSVILGEAFWYKKP